MIAEGHGPLKVAVVGAGFAGLATARVLRALGHEVVVHEQAPDVGGVWSATRRYPGVRTQNDKGTYALSELPMPRAYPQWPSGGQVQEYLRRYVDAFDLAPCLRLGSTVVSAEPDDAGPSWRLRVRAADGTEDVETADHLVVANGTYSRPFVPALPGREAFEAAGGRVLAASEVHDAEVARGRHALVIGYGKSACDVSVPLSGVAASTTVVARHLLWKMPTRIAGVVNYKYLMLTRLGEALFRWIEPRGVERFLHGPGDPVRRRIVAGLQAVVTRQLRLRALGLVPRGSFEDIARSTVSLVTDGFYEAVGAGRITVHRDTEVVRLLAVAGAPHAELSTGAVVPADLVVCGTGHEQVVPFLDPAVQERLHDGRGNFRLHRGIAPLDVPHLSFAGYSSSFFSPLSAEMSAVWIGHHLIGAHELPARDRATAQVDERLAWMQERTDGRHSRGTNVIPFSMHAIDEVLDDLGLNISPARRALQWLLPVDPRAYRSVLPALVARQAALQRERAGAASGVGGRQPRG